MPIYCLGLNYRSAPVEVRERFAILDSRQGEEAKQMVLQAGVSEAVVLSTCNRTEYYLVGSESDWAGFKHFIIRHLSLDSIAQECFYDYKGREAAKHLCRVMSGMDSMVLGETEIFGQVKKAYQLALEVQATRGNLNQLFQKAISVAKKVRNSTQIQMGQTSIGNVAVDLAEKIFGDLGKSPVMIIGAGEMSRVTGQSLLSRGAKSIFVANRSFDKAESLAQEMSGKAVRFDDWADTLSQVDVVISSTSAPHYLIGPDDIEAVRRKRKFRPLFLIDIAVPRDINPEVTSIEEVYLYDIDALEQIADKARDKRQAQLKLCEEIVKEAVEGMSIFGVVESS